MKSVEIRYNRKNECETLESYININEVARLKNLKSNRSIRKEISKGNESKYISREVNTKGGKTYEILIATLEPEVQAKVLNERLKSAQLTTINNVVSFEAEKNEKIGLDRFNIVTALMNYRKKYAVQKQADMDFIALYNTGKYLVKQHAYIQKLSFSTLQRWVKDYQEYGTADALTPKYKFTKQGERVTKLTREMISIFKGFWLDENQFQVSKAISFTKQVLSSRGFMDLPSDMTFRRFAQEYKKNHYGEWVLRRLGEKAFNDLVEPYIERDPSLLEVGEVLIADGHTLNFQVINPFTGKPTRATLVGFVDWKSTALVGYEIMMSENTQCIASALRNSILNLGRIPTIVYQDNGKAFRAKYFQNCNFNEAGFNGIYANLGIKSVFAKVRNAKAKIIERFFLDFQEEFEKLMISYTGTSIETRPARLKRGEKLHKEMHKKLKGDRVPTVQEVIKLLDKWIEYDNNKKCPNVPDKTIKEVLNTVQKEEINPAELNSLMMKTETKTIHRNGIRFLYANYYSEALFGLRIPVYVRYSLFDLSKVDVYTTKGEFLCAAKRITKTHPMAYHLGSKADMEDLKQKITKQIKRKNKAIKEYKRYFEEEQVQLLQVEPEPEIIEAEVVPQIPKQKKLSEREQQMKKPIFISNCEKYEWLLKHGCTNSDERSWIENYKKSDEYYNLYEVQNDYEENFY